MGRVFDVGCSDGAITRRIAARWPRATVTGLDVTEWDIRQPCTGGPLIDAIFCTEVLEHLFPHESQIALANLWTILKSTGQLIVTVPNREYDDRLRARWAWPDHRQYFSYASLNAVLRRQFAAVQLSPIVDGIWLGAVCTK